MTEPEPEPELFDVESVKPGTAIRYMVHPPQWAPAPVAVYTAILISDPTRADIDGKPWPSLKIRDKKRDSQVSREYIIGVAEGNVVYPPRSYWKYDLKEYFQAEKEKLIARRDERVKVKPARRSTVDA